MPDMLKQGLGWLARQRTQHMTSAVQYQRPGQLPITVQATFGRTEYEVADGSSGGGSTIRTHVVDFLVLADDLVDLHPLQRGDVILADGQQHEVLDLPGEGVWRWSDPYHTTLRIHTKDIGPPPPEVPPALGNQP